MGTFFVKGFKYIFIILLLLQPCHQQEPISIQYLIQNVYTQCSVALTIKLKSSLHTK